MSGIRYFIVTPGRTGSSLLSSILADAGADFGIPAAKEWDRARGASMESPLILKAAHLMARMERQKPLSSLARIRWKRTGQKVTAATRAALETAVYLKSAHLDLIVPVAERLGYQPRIILSVRDYTSIVLSFARWRPYHVLYRDYLLPQYLQILHDGILLMERHGGCVVDYHDLMGGEDWAERVARVTGLDRDKLVEAHAIRVQPRHQTLPPSLNTEADTLYQTVRNWVPENTDRPTTVAT